MCYTSLSHLRNLQDCLCSTIRITIIRGKIPARFFSFHSKFNVHFILIFALHHDSCPPLSLIFTLTLTLTLTHPISASSPRTWTSLLLFSLSYSLSNQLPPLQTTSHTHTKNPYLFIFKHTPPSHTPYTLIHIHSNPTHTHSHGRWPWAQHSRSSRTGISNPAASERFEHHSLCHHPCQPWHLADDDCLMIATRHGLSHP